MRLNIESRMPRVIPLRMLDRGWLPWEISTKLDDCADRAKSLTVAVWLRRAAKWSRENL